jgi:glycosyltransferase involved in cell wall biosynthesis
VSRLTLVGRPLAAYAAGLGVPSERLSVVHNGTELPLRWSADQRPRDAVRVVLSVCNLVPLKGIDLNLRAFAEIRLRSPHLAWRYRVVGDGPERSALVRLAGSLGLSDRVEFLGRLDYQATMAEMAACDIFCLPSWGDSFGVVYLEAMSRGRPVIGCLDWGAAEMVRDGIDGRLVKPKDEHSLATALGELLSDPSRCASMGEDARRRAGEFSWDANVRRHLGCFRPVPEPALVARLPG